MYSAILWDNDGVLVETEPIFYEVSRQTLIKYGVTLTHEIFAEHSLRQGRSLFEYLRDAGVSEATMAAERVAQDARYVQLVRAAPPCAKLGILEILAHFSTKIRMGVVTSCERELFAQAHAHSGVPGYMNFVYAREDYHLTKPNPEPYLKALREQNLDLARSVVVEDTPRGVASAKAAGLYCVGVEGPYIAAADLTQADCVVAGTQHLLPILRDIFKV